MPGALPVMNKEAMRFALRAGEALGCTVNQQSRFARKNYFYPDSPKGYQTSQFAHPILEGGTVTIDLVDGSTRAIALTRIHLEEDAGKTIHSGTHNQSYVDLNRCGVPLIEIVSEPELRSSEEASAYLKELRNIVRYLEICDGHMEQGSFRCDANVSIRLVGQTELGTRVELKNINSFNYVKRAIEYEFARQCELLDEGNRVIQETRLWDADAGRSKPMRSKEEAHDYRYFPCPDLLPLVVPQELWDEVKANLAELPRARRERYQRDYGLSDYDAEVLTSEKEISEYFQEVVNEGADPKSAANWVQGELRGRLNADSLEMNQSPVSPIQLSTILSRIATGKLSGNLAKKVFARVYDGEEIDAVLADVGEQLTDATAISTQVIKVLNAHPDEVQSYLDGKNKVLGFFMGKIMQATAGKANPGMVRQVLTEHLESRR
jgi:aspartyl-tRNA(Asn)/glutamyl-tRNA(Gln) amidotransferase subunit B